MAIRTPLALSMGGGSKQPPYAGMENLNLAAVERIARPPIGRSNDNL